MFLIYQLLITLIILFSPIIILIRIFKGKEDILRFKEKFCFFSKKRFSGKLLWIHGSSVGELMSVLPILNKYDRDDSFNQILVTSSTLSSSKIQDALSILTKNKTTIVIAHRLSTILNSSNIYVIDSGNMVASGSHEELLKNSDLYKNFYEKQIQK